MPDRYRGERDDTDGTVGELLIGEDSADLICDRLRLVIITVVRIAHPAFDVNINQWRLDALGGSRDSKWQNLVLVERPVRVCDDWRDTTEVFAEHHLVSGKNSRSQIV